MFAIYSRLAPLTATARCAIFNPYTILALLTFGIFLFYFFRLILEEPVTTKRSRKTFTTDDKQTSQIQRIYSCLMRGRELWDCWNVINCQKSKLSVKWTFKRIIVIFISNQKKGRPGRAQSVRVELSNRTELFFSQVHWCNKEMIVLATLFLILCQTVGSVLQPENNVTYEGNRFILF